MRILVAGPFPPAPDRAAMDVLHLVQCLIAQGHEVEVVSPLPSAAEHHGPLVGFKGAVALARWSRHFDALYLHVSRFMLFRPELPQARRVVDGLLISLALRLWGSTSADLGDLSDVPGGGGGLSGRLVWSSIDKVLVAQESVRHHAVKVLHMPASRVRASPVGRDPALAEGSPRALPGDPGAYSPLLPWRIHAPADWDGVMAQVRDRAAAQRALLAPGAVLGPQDHEGS